MQQIDRLRPVQYDETCSAVKKSDQKCLVETFSLKVTKNKLHIKGL